MAGSKQEKLIEIYSRKIDDLSGKYIQKHLKNQRRGTIILIYIYMKMMFWFQDL